MIADLSMVTRGVLGLVMLLAADGPSAAAPPPPQTLVAPSSERAGDLLIGFYQPGLPNDLAGLSLYEDAAGRPAGIVSWYALWGGWKSVFSREDLDAVSAHGSLPMITWEPWAGVAADPAWSLRAAILSGVYDAYIESWAAGLAAYGRPVLLRFAHEMHDRPDYPWAVGVNGNTSAEYVQAWRHVRAIFQRAGASNVAWVWNPNTLGAAQAADYTAVYRDLYPGDAEVDLVALDVFNTGPAIDWGAPTWRSFDEILEEPYQAITTISTRPLIVAEVGSAEIGGAKAAWVESVLDDSRARFPRVRAVVWFDVDKEQPWSLRSSPAVLETWLAEARRSAVR